jgi:hypothetical protein
MWGTVAATVGALLIGIAVGASAKTKTTASPAAANAVPATKATTVYITLPAAAPKAAPATTAPQAPPPTTANPTTASATIPGDGTYVVGTDIKPGLYKTSGPSASGFGDCYWEREKDLSGGFGSILANDNAKGQTTVKILSSDAAFKTSGCADWVKIG